MEQPSSTPTSQGVVCFHHLVGSCKFGDSCWKNHSVQESDLSENQAKAFEFFRNSALGEHQLASPKRHKVEQVPVPSPPEEDPEDSIPSCFHFNFVGCSRTKCGKVHRQLFQYSDDELIQFENFLHKKLSVFKSK